jgi:hypothetical protein
MLKLSELRYLKFDTEYEIYKAEEILKGLTGSNEFYWFQDGEMVSNRRLVEEGLKGLRERVVRLSEIIDSGVDSVHRQK